MAPTVWIFERTQRLRVRAISVDLAIQEASRDDAPWDVGEIELIDRKDDDDAQA